jgi:alpha-glucosidase
VVSVQAQSTDPTSMLTLYRRLIALRREYSALAYGDYEPVAMIGDLIAYVRNLDGRRLLIALNLGGDPHAVSFSAVITAPGRVLLSTHLDRQDEKVKGEVNLRADEGIIVALDAS